MEPHAEGRIPAARCNDCDAGFPSLQLDAPTLVKPEYTFDGFLSEVIRPNPKIAIVAVSKARFQYRIGVCVAEYSRIKINQTPRDTVAVESTDADAVLELVSTLGIHETNVSYIREIRRIVGWGA